MVLVQINWQWHTWADQSTNPVSSAPVPKSENGQRRCGKDCYTKSHEGDTRHKEKYSFMEFDIVSKKIIGSAIEVHKFLGPGLLESAYVGSFSPVHEAQILTRNFVSLRVFFVELRVTCSIPSASSLSIFTAMN